MRHLRITLLACIAVLVATVIAYAQRAPAPPARQKAPMAQQQQAPSASSQAIYKEVERTLGFVPQWIRAIPDALLEGWWSALHDFQLNPNTRLDNKTKELIGLAVASQIPCDYCVQYHTEAARKNGATAEEIREAVGMASVTRMGSTLLNGLQIDKQQFKRDLDRMRNGGGKQAKASKRR